MNLWSCKTSESIKLPRLGLLLILLFQAGQSPAQSTGSLSGRVTDSKTKEPIPYATAFLANTMIGTEALVDGTFSLRNIPVGKYDLTVSSTGYKLATLPVSIPDGEKTLSVQLHQDVKILKEVVIKRKRLDYAKLKAMFTQYFLGETDNAGKCTIANMDDIDLDYDEETKVLTATAAKPIEIENDALGFKVFYFLNEFKLDLIKQVDLFVGVPRFEALVPSTKAQARRWVGERARAYYGSLTHFMRSLKFNCLKEDDFYIYLEQKNKWIPINESFFLSSGPDSLVRLKIVYQGETQEYNYSRQNVYSYQTSYLKFRKNDLLIHDNGYYENPLKFYLEGYLAWSEKIAELLPLEYQPPSKHQ